MTNVGLQHSLNPNRSRIFLVILSLVAEAISFRAERLVITASDRPSAVVKVPAHAVSRRHGYFGKKICISVPRAHPADSRGCDVLASQG